MTSLQEKRVTQLLSTLLALIAIPLVILSGWITVNAVQKTPFDSNTLLILSFPLTFALVFGMLAWRGFASADRARATLSTRAWKILAAVCVLIGIMAGIPHWFGMLLPFAVAFTCLLADPKIHGGLADMLPKHIGYVQIMRITGIPFFVHWSLLGTCIFISYLMDFDPYLTLFCCIGFIFVIIVHEVGHAIAARMCGLEVYAIQLFWNGGICWLESPKQIRDCAFVYSGGFIAQLVLLGITVWYVQIVGEPTSIWGNTLFASFTFINVLLIVVNLIPAQNRKGMKSDGLILWQLLLHRYWGHPYPQLSRTFISSGSSPVFDPTAELLSMPSMIPQGFEQGVEILNDNITPMNLVITLLTRHFEIEDNDAVTWMLNIHNNGGMLVPLPNILQAQQIATALMADAKAEGYNFVCRAVVVPKIQT